MAAYGIRLDQAGTVLNIADNTSYFLLGLDAPEPPVNSQYVGAIGVDGDQRIESTYGNRTITVTLRVIGSSDSDLEDKVQAVQAAVTKQHREGGTLEITTPASTVVYYDVLDASFNVTLDKRYMARQIAVVTLAFTCLPYGKGAEVTLSDHTETTLPALVFTEASVTGDVPALGRLVVDEDDGDSQAWVAAALRSRRYSSQSLTERLFYEAENLTPLGGSAAVAGSGFSGTASGSSAVDVDNLATDWEAVLSTTASTAALTSVTGANSTDIFTKASHGLTNGTPVRLSSLSGGSGLSTSTQYYVVSASTGFQLATSVGGSAVDLGSDVSSVTVTPETRAQHVGAYRVFARVQADSSNTGIVGVCLEWGVGDFRNPQRNAPTYLTSSRLSGSQADIDAGAVSVVEDQWLLADLGIVNIPPVLTGTQYLEGRLLAKSTVLADRLFIDHLLLFPVDEFYAEASKGPIGAAATAFVAYDDFSAGTYAGDLASDTAPTGGTWGTTASPYEASDFAVSGGYAQRTAVSDTSTDIKYGRIMYPSGTAAMTNTAAFLSWLAPAASASNLHQGIAFRIVDKDNFGAAVWNVGAQRVDIYKVVSGTVTLIGAAEGQWSPTGLGESIDIRALADGSVSATFTGANGAFSATATAQDAVFAAGATLDDGYCGILDWYPDGVAMTRQYAGFHAFAPVPDAAVFASQSIQFRHDGCVREDAAGSYWQPVSKYTGDYLLVPPSGREARTTQVIVKACRNDPRTGADSALDDISAQLHVTPRFLTLPA